MTADASALTQAQKLSQKQITVGSMVVVLLPLWGHGPDNVRGFDALRGWEWWRLNAGFERSDDPGWSDIQQEGSMIRCTTHYNVQALIDPNTGCIDQVLSDL